MPCQDAKPVEICRVPQTPEPISAASDPKFAILWEHVEEILLVNNFFLIVDTCLSCEDSAKQSCGMVPRWRFFASFLRPVFQRSACSTFQTCILNSLHQGHTMCRSMVDIQSPTAEIRRGKKRRKKKKEQTTAWKYNGLPYSIGRP